nr:ribosomal protein S3 [Nitzschia ovalis]
MGQKINPTIFRLGINKTWKTEFFEKKNRELPLYNFKDLETRNYIERVLENNGILLHDYKQYYNDSKLNLYISYFVTPEFVTNKKDTTEKIIFKNSNGQRKIVKRLAQTNSDLSFTGVTHFASSDARRFYKVKKYLNTSLNNHLLAIQPNIRIKSSNDLELKVKGVFSQIFKVLNLFVGSSAVIHINLCCVNKNAHFLKSTKKKTFLSLQRFKNTTFFKEGIELLFHVVYNENSANLLAKFIASQIKKVKRQKFLLSFLKQTLTLLLESNLAKLKGIKIILKGRLNGVPRAKHKIIIIGDVPVQSLATKLDYAQTAAHNSNGSYGIKVWLVEK